jgi:hypothetical protein
VIREASSRAARDNPLGLPQRELNGRVNCMLLMWLMETRVTRSKRVLFAEPLIKNPAINLGMSVSIADIEIIQMCMRISETTMPVIAMDRLFCDLRSFQPCS